MDAAALPAATAPRRSARARLAGAIEAFWTALTAPTPVVLSDWTDADVAYLAKLITGMGDPPPKPSPDGRERRMLRLLLTDQRSVVPDTELASKFGTATKFSLELDLPELRRHCTAQGLVFPLVRVDGDPGHVRRTLTQAQLRELRRQV